MNLQTNNNNTFLGLSPASTAVLLGMIGLAGLSLLTMYALDNAEMPTNIVPPNVFRSQAIFMAFSFGVMLVVRSMNYQRIGDMAYPLFILTIMLLAMVLVFGKIGQHVGFIGQFFPYVNGSCRWIRLPHFQVQPSEFFKIVFILGLARYLRYRKNYRQFRGLIGPFALTLLPTILILLEPDLGTVLLLLPILFVMLYAAGAKIKHLIAIILMMLACVPILFAMMHDYQRGRIVGVLLQSNEVRDWLDNNPKVKEYVYPGKDLKQWSNSVEGFHLSHSKTAIGTGGIFGNGLGKGPYMESSRKLPECHNDFVFAIIAHQFGLFGAASIVMFYLIIATGLAEIATRTAEPLGRLVAVGILAMLLIQAGVNIGMTLGLMPITGLTLPFVSYGGSSLLTFFILIGLALGIDRLRPIQIGPKPFEFQDDY
jgi:rod shape determining protein RodA